MIKNHLTSHVLRMETGYSIRKLIDAGMDKNRRNEKPIIMKSDSTSHTLRMKTEDLVKNLIEAAMNKKKRK